MKQALPIRINTLLTIHALQSFAFFPQIINTYQSQLIFYSDIAMWGLQINFGINWEQTLPQITLNSAIYMALALLALRAFIQRILAIYFQINQSRLQHNINTLQYSYFYHLSIVVLILTEINWNMFDLSVWILSYVGVGMIRKAVYIIRIEKDISINDFSYNKKIMVILSASRLFALFVFACSILYFIAVQVIFQGISVRIGSLLLFPTLMLAVDSVFLFFSSLSTEKEILCYFNQNINEIPSSHKLQLAEGIVSNSLRVWHYYNLIRLFAKAFFQKLGYLDCVWMVSVINAFYISSTSLYASITKYRSYANLLQGFNRTLRPSKTAPDQTCVICMTQLLNCRRLSTCGHLFHYKCLFSWIQTKNDCPICRCPINLTDQ